MRSVFDAIKVTKAVDVGTITGTGTPVATRVSVVDTFGYNSGSLALQVSGTTTGTAMSSVISFNIQESATSDGTFANTGITGTVTGTALAGGYVVVARIEGLGTSRMRYLKVTPLVTMTPNDGTVLGGISAVFLLGRAYREPVGNSPTA